jgi:hypothetical protein
MGYRIDYGPVKKIRSVEKRKSGLAALTGLFFLLFVITVCCLWPEGVAELRQILLPGDAAVTTSAMEELTDSLRAGEKIVDSIRTFCARILEGAALDSAG